MRFYFFPILPRGLNQTKEHPMKNRFSHAKVDNQKLAKERLAQQKHQEKIQKKNQHKKEHELQEEHHEEEE